MLHLLGEGAGVLKIGSCRGRGEDTDGACSRKKIRDVDGVLKEETIASFLDALN